MRGVLEALHQGDYDTAIERLTRKALFGSRAEAKEALLLLAEVHSLYGEEGLERAHRALEEAYELGGLELDPLYRALLGELLAQEGRDEREVLPLFLPTEDPRARYHQAQALFYLGRFEEVLRTLKEGLPAFLAWRAEGLRGRALERLGHPAEAALAYERGAELALGVERYWLLLDAAAMWLEAGEAERALLALEEAAEAVGEEPVEDAATRHYLLARAHLLLENPNRALEEVREALRLEEEGGHKAYGTPLLEGQILLRLGRYPEGMDAFQEALRRAEGGERGHVLHEMAVAALDQGAYLEAEAHLQALLREEGYPYRAQALADLAEALYRQGRYGEAEEAAKAAIEEGVEAAGELILGHVAYDLMHLEEALLHYRKAAEVAEEGSREWVGAQEMVVDTLAQLGYRSPEEILARAEAVLPYVHPGDEWHQALLAYRERAGAILREGRRPN
ncbi:tetratricopeptide repeat protein [Thermus thermamylovorans]|uniref:Tetratricopeptide repeat protein n=1 Tax=Thermus thermamylovorans TaxID=2509362 RepID=A0A4Q9B5Y8_9DEIN|nr:tetratricopeptide repeat protein [Thermus thermamylovorans]TBH21352.1 tetratricopeptide repeat protein [Thermus thermamylovorans]